MIRNIKILAIGKLPKEFQPICDHYMLLLGNKLEISEIIPKKNIRGQEIMAEEEGAILGKIKDHEYVILLDVKGKAMESENFAKMLQNNSDKKITFVIGGAYGVSSKVRDRADSKISLSSLTFPHMLARMILLEQIYRAKSILENHPYHK